MIVDIEMIAEDEKNVCYKSVFSYSPNLFLVSKSDRTVVPIVVGDRQSMAVALAKLKRSTNTGELPRLLTLAIS